MSRPLIDVDDLVKSFAGRVVVSGVSLHVYKGEVFGFLGPNGSGKTTTIRMLCGLLTPDAGRGKCLGFDIFSQSMDIKRQVGYMTQKFSLYTDLSVAENLDFIARVYQISSRAREIERVLEDFDLGSKRNQLAGELSGGWKQRLALACCLLHQPKLLLLEEPTAGVDPLARRAFWDKIHGLGERGITTLVSTHYMDEAERCTRLAYLAKGALLMTGTVQEVIDSTHLITWAIKGNVTTELLHEVKLLPGVVQAALFGSQIHVCGYDETLLALSVTSLKAHHGISFERIDSTLEDAFISLVNRASASERRHVS